MMTQHGKTNNIPARRRLVRRGQSTVEFALVFMLMMVVIVGVLEASRLVFINAEIDNAAREGARYAALSPSVNTGSLRNAISSKLALTNLAEVTITGPTYSPTAGQRCAFCRVSVTVSYQWQTSVPFLNLGPVTLQSTATTLIENAGN